MNRILRIIDLYGTPHEAKRCIYRDIIRYVRTKEYNKISLMSWIVLREACKISLIQPESEYLQIELLDSPVSERIRIRNTTAALYALIGIIETHFDKFS